MHTLLNKEQISENASAIATFMGYDMRPDGNFRVAMGTSTKNPADFTYHKSWDSLMSVLDEIQLRNFTPKYLMGVVTIFGTNRAAIQCYKHEQLLHVIDCSGSDAAYRAAVQYIEWHKLNLK